MATLTKNAIVDTFANYVPCLAFGQAACANVDETISSLNATVMLCFVTAKPPKHNPLYPNSNGKVWLYEDSFIFETGTQQSKPELKREVNLKAPKP